VPASRSESVRAHWAGLSRQERQERTKSARMAYHVKQLVDNWPTLDPKQVARLRSLLQQPGGGRDGAA
jgi:hypothetical protein